MPQHARQEARVDPRPNPSPETQEAAHEARGGDARPAEFVTLVEAVAALLTLAGRRRLREGEASIKYRPGGI
jgi:hypothetical protein